MIANTVRPAAVVRPPRFSRLVATLLGAIITLGACSALEYRDDICNSGEYAVLPIGGTGGACVRDGEQPPAGFVRYPEGKVPQKVDDEWDVYWRSHTIDKDGAIVSALAAG